MYCSNCGKELTDKAVVCPQCGCIANSEMYNAAFNAASQSTPENQNSITPQTNNAYQQKPVEDKPNPGFSVLAFLMPIFGFVIYLCEHKKTPIACKRYLIWSIISVVLWGLFYVLYIAACVVIALISEGVL